MAESQIVIRIDRELLREFRAECIRRDTTPTQALTQLLRQQLGQWAQQAQSKAPVQALP